MLKRDGIDRIRGRRRMQQDTSVPKASRDGAASDEGPRSIVITGASSGLGAALAEIYAAPGVVLGLIGRNGPRLEAVARRCRDWGAATVTGEIDVTDRDGLSRWLTAFDDATPVELIIANAGSNFRGSEGETEEEKSRYVIDVNLMGTLNTIYPIMPRLTARRRGQIALIASTQGLRGHPRNAAYCAAKAALITLGQSLRATLKADGVRLSVVVPATFRTPAVSDMPRQPFETCAETAALRVRRALANDRGRFGFPRPVYLYARLVGTLPARVIEVLDSRRGLVVQKLCRALLAGRAWDLVRRRVYPRLQTAVAVVRRPGRTFSRQAPKDSPLPVREAS
jgi:short-subunit dehydrogenase